MTTPAALDRPRLRGAALLLAGAIAGTLIGALLLRRPAPPAASPAPGPVPAQAQGEDARERVALPPGAHAKNPIETVTVARVHLARDVEVVGSVGYDADRFATIGPLIAGRIASVRAGIGDKIRAGQVLAELESAEVGQARAAYLTARATSLAAQANLRRERELAEQKVSSARERELAEAHAATESANLAAATQRLRALGLRAADITQLQQNEQRAGHVPLVSPIVGVVLTRSITLGQSVQPATDAFTVADLTHLWVLLDLFEKDLPHVHVGQRAELRTEVYPGRHFPARVSYVSQVIDEKTRTAPVRVEFDNKEGLFRPGQFVTATLHGEKPGEKPGEKLSAPPVLAVPRRAIVTVEGRPLAFVAEADGTFTRRVVELGVSGGGLVEVRAGLSEGEKVAANGAFLLKSELLR